MEQLSNAVIDHCLEETKASRKFMEENPVKPLPKNYAEYPGKMDHITCVCMRGTYKPKNLRNSYSA